MYFFQSSVDVELFTLARGRGLTCSSHVAAQHSPTLETDRCHAIAERKWQGDQWCALINKVNGLRAITLDFHSTIVLPFQCSPMQFSLIYWYSSGCDIHDTMVYQTKLAGWRYSTHSICCMHTVNVESYWLPCWHYSKMRGQWPVMTPARHVLEL